MQGEGDKGIPAVSVADFQYTLPATRIAEEPLTERDSSRLLCFDATTEAISHRTFRDLPEILPEQTLLIMNDTRVVKARLLFPLPSGRPVEILLLDPVSPSADPAVTLASDSPVSWTCMVGGLRKLEKLKQVELPLAEDVSLTATMVERTESSATILFDWPGWATFAEVLDRLGHVPIPPYIEREDQPVDVERYQTVYAAESGAVAAPTAGLHFTESLLSRIRSAKVDLARITLHVGAGTFAPMKGDRVASHRMHSERFRVTHDLLRQLRTQSERQIAVSGAPTVAVGTTSVRVLESLYWLASRLSNGEVLSNEPHLAQWDAYSLENHTRELSRAEVLELLQQELDRRQADHLDGTTAIMIVPGYRFRMIDALITNFHQPESTLIMLIAAWLGGDRWREVYDEALRMDYRFLSYGDSSLLIRDRFEGSVS